MFCMVPKRSERNDNNYEKSKRKHIENYGHKRKKEKKEKEQNK